MSQKDKPKNVATVIQFPQKTTALLPDSEQAGGEVKRPDHANHESKPTPRRHPRSKILMKSTYSIAVIFAVPLLAIWVTGHMDNSRTKEISGSRSLASVANIDMERDEAFESKLVQDLKSGHREPASVKLGHAPSAIDRLRYDVLNGEYRIVMSERTVSEIHATDETHRLIDFKQVLDFLHRQTFLFAGHGVQIQKVSEGRSPQGVAEVYEILGDKGEAVASVDVQLDTFRRLRSLAIRR